MHTYIYIYLYTYIYRYIYIYIYTCIYIHKYIYLHIFLFLYFILIFTTSSQSHDSNLWHELEKEARNLLLTLEGGGILGGGGAGGVQDALAARARLEIARGRHEGSGVAMCMKVTALGVLMGGFHVCLVLALHLEIRGHCRGDTYERRSVWGVDGLVSSVSCVLGSVCFWESASLFFRAQPIEHGHVQKYSTEKK